MRAVSSRWFTHGMFAAGIGLLLVAAAACGLAERLFPFETVGALLAGHSNRAGASFFGADYYAGVIQRGQWRDTDEVCEALLRAVHTLRTHFDLMPGEA